MPTLDLSFDTSDVSLERIHDALAVSFYYPETIQGERDEETGKPTVIPNPESKADYNRRMIKELVSNRVLEGEKMMAEQQRAKMSVPHNIFE